MRLYVIEDYNNKGHSYQAGQEIDVDKDVANWLMADAPGCFSQEAPKVEKALEEPVKNKQVKRAPRKK